MAMIPCSECGKSISDKALKCVHCGKSFEEITSSMGPRCFECGANISESDSSCPSCGCPTGIQEYTPDSAASPILVAEVASVKVKSKSKKTVVILAIALIMMCALSVFAIKYIGEIQAEKKFNAEFNTYIDNLEKANELMRTSAKEAEYFCVLTHDVWQNAIYKNYDSITDRYTRPDGYFVSDFNVALENMFADSGINAKVLEIKSSQAAVKEVMKSLQNPPEGLERCYDTLVDLYPAYMELTNLAVNPYGSFNDYSAMKASTLSAFLRTYEKLESQIPERKAEK